MKNISEGDYNSNHVLETNSTSPSKILDCVCLEPGLSDSKSLKAPLSSVNPFCSLPTFGTQFKSKNCATKGVSLRNYRWTTSIKRLMNSCSMWKIRERWLGLNNTGISISGSDIWLLGVCYRKTQEDSSGASSTDDGVASFVQDFSSRILLTYRKGFAAIGDSKYTSDVNWGCMLRSSQMLVAQALIVHRLGRSWRKAFDKPLDKDYIEILHLFGDSESSPFSIHNLVQAGNGYDLAAGSWVGPYAMCRTWEYLARLKSEESEVENQSFPMAIYVVSGDEDGERGGAPVVCIEDVSRHCLEFSKGMADWAPVLLLVPLVLGLDKVNPRYIPLLAATFTFPQSLGILGGRPGASTYLIGVQEEEAFYLDPHEVQQVADIKKDNLEADTASYHCNVLRHVPLESIDPSLAIGFYCKDKVDFDDFCDRASKLAEKSMGAPLFTVTQTRNVPRASDNSNNADESLDFVPENNAEGDTQEDEWQLL